MSDQQDASKFLVSSMLTMDTHEALLGTVSRNSLAWGYEELSALVEYLNSHHSQVHLKIWQLWTNL